jgi:hypothetical protein
LSGQRIIDGLKDATDPMERAGEAIRVQIEALMSERDALRAEVERLREALDMIGNHGLDARQCMQAARAALSSPPSGG